MSETLLRATDLVKVYGRPPHSYSALRGVSLSVARSDCMAIVGKSGSGKSTLMHVLALLDSPSQGQVEVFGQSTRGLGRRAVDQLRNRKFGFVFQQFFLDARRSVLDNVTLPLAICGVGRGQREERGREVLGQVGLAELARKRANDLSGGEKQRVAIARALANRPDVLFADEPTGNLDSVTGKDVADLLFGLNQDRGITLLLVTHDLDLAARCPRAIELRDGQIVSERNP